MVIKKSFTQIYSEEKISMLLFLADARNECKDCSTPFCLVINFIYFLCIVLEQDEQELFLFWVSAWKGWKLSRGLMFSNVSNSFEREGHSLSEIQYLIFSLFYLSNFSPPLFNKHIWLLCTSREEIWQKLRKN